MSDRKLVVVTSKERDFLLKLREAIRNVGNIIEKRSGFGSIGYDLLIKRVALYDKLQAIGLTPRKSLTIGPLSVPDDHFHDFFRGVVDGDGNIRRWIHPTNGREQWTVRVFGCSRPFLDWIRATARRLWHLEGAMCEEKANPETRRHTKYTLKYGKLAAKVIFKRCYYQEALALERKQRLAEACVATSVGWAKSKTVLDRASWKGWKYEHIWENRMANLTNPNVDPTSGLVREPDGVWAGVSERRR